MSFDRSRYVRHLPLALGVLLLPSCANEARSARDVGVWVGPLALECASAPADVAGDFLAILSSVDPLDPSQPQVYGSEHCAGVIFEFDNPEAEPLRGAWIQASGETRDSSDVLSESLCQGRALEADYWGFKDKEWSQLAVSTGTASFEPGSLADTGYCHLDAVIESPGAFEKLRIVARVTQGPNTYPMYACVW